MGCRKFKGEAFFDDLTQETHLPEELERIVFAFDGQALEIDLTDDNADAFREAMAPFVAASRPTSKSKVLASLPKKRRHLQAVPSPVIEDAPQEEPQNAPISPKGENVETPSEPEGTQVPEEPSKPSDFTAPEEPARPALTVVPPARTPIPDQWAPMAPHPSDDKRNRVFKARKWATAMHIDPSITLTPEIFDQWETFYNRQGWLNL